MWLCVREPRGQDYYRHHPFFPPFSYWRPLVLHRLGQYAHQNPGSSKGTWVRRLSFQDYCISHQHLTHNREIAWSHTLSSGVTKSVPHLLDSLPENRLTHILWIWKYPFCGGLVYLLGKQIIFLNPVLSPGVFLWRTLGLGGDLFSSPVSLGVQSVSSAQMLKAKVCLCKSVKELPTAIILLLVDK